MLFQTKANKSSASLWMGITFVLGLVFIGILIYAFQPKGTTPPLITDSSTQIAQHLKITFVHNAKDPGQQEKIKTFLTILVDPKNGLKSTVIDDTWVDASSSEGQEIIKTADAKYLPVAFFGTEVERHPQFESIKTYLQKIGDRYFFHLRPLEQLKTPPFAGLPYRGIAPEKAKVVIVEFGSFTCHFCRQMEWEEDDTGALKPGVVPKILQAYGDKVSFVYKHFDRSGIDSMLAQASECANEQKKFWEFHDVLFKEQPTFLKNLQASTDVQKDLSTYLQTVTTKLGLNAQNFQQCLTSGKYAKSIQDSTAEATDYGVEGTPGFFVGSKYYEGATDYATMKGYVDEAMKN